MDSAHPELRERSRVWFGSQYFLEVALLIREGRHQATVRRIAQAVGVGDSTIRPLVERLVALGLVERLPMDRTGIRLARLSHKSWRIVNACIRESLP